MKRIVCWLRGHVPIMGLAGVGDNVVGVWSDGPWAGKGIRDTGRCFRCWDGRKKGAT
jgi:hypothetical protein